MSGLENKKHFFFDMDGTLTPSRSCIDADMRGKLNALAQVADVCIVSGSSVEQIKKQLRGVRGINFLGQNGNHAIRLQKDKVVTPKEVEVWKHTLTWQEQHDIFNYIKSIFKLVNPYNSEADCVENRGAQISLSFVGHNAPSHIKFLFDPSRTIRRDILIKYPFVHETLEVAIGGTTCLDFFPKEHNKGRSVSDFIHYVGWDAEKSIYIGDALEENGNDHSVVKYGHIETLSVKDENDTRDFIQEIIKAAGITVK